MSEMPKKIKRTFLKLGTCSRTLFYFLNREFDHPMELEECASDPLAGGIHGQGYQCGMLSGSAMAIGAESYKRCGNLEQATALTVKATQHIMASFKEQTGHHECAKITECDFNDKKSMAKYMLTGKFLSCFKLADNWIPKAINSANEALENNYGLSSDKTTNCASEVIRKMGGTEEQQAMVAGFAGGMGLSGSGCGALAAAIWMGSLKWCKENEAKRGYLNPSAEKTLETFQKATDYEFRCNKICDKKFESLDDHSDFITNGGCKELIETLTQS
jgi:hypothetical protein